MQDLVVWSGPVGKFDVKGATVPGAEELFVGCCGDLTPPCKPPTCPTVGEGLRHDPATLAAKAGMSVAELGDLFLAAFSAGGSVVHRCLTNPDYRVLTTAVMLSDATYTGGWVDLENRIPPAIEGHVLYALDVIGSPGDKLFVATASPSPNKAWATGVENLAAIRLEIERRSGLTFQKLDHFFGIEPAPEVAYRLGNVIFAEYPMEPLGHGHHKVAPAVWQNVLLPWLSKGKGPLDQPGGLVDPPPPGPGPVGPSEPPAGDEGVPGWLLAAGVLATGLAVTAWLLRRRSS